MKSFLRDFVLCFAASALTLVLLLLASYVKSWWERRRWGRKPF